MAGCKDHILLQLAGHLKGRVLQEWNLLSADEKGSYDRVLDPLGNQLDPVNNIPANPILFFFLDRYLQILLIFLDSFDLF